MDMGRPEHLAAMLILHMSVMSSVTAVPLSGPSVSVSHFRNQTVGHFNSSSDGSVGMEKDLFPKSLQEDPHTSPTNGSFRSLARDFMNRPTTSLHGITTGDPFNTVTNGASLSIQNGSLHSISTEDYSNIVTESTPSDLIDSTTDRTTEDLEHMNTNLTWEQIRNDPSLVPMDIPALWNKDDTDNRNVRGERFGKYAKSTKTLAKKSNNNTQADHKEDIPEKTKYSVSNNSETDILNRTNMREGKSRKDMSDKQNPGTYSSESYINDTSQLDKTSNGKSEIDMTENLENTKESQSYKILGRPYKTVFKENEDMFRENVTYGGDFSISDTEPAPLTSLTISIKRYEFNLTVNNKMVFEGKTKSLNYTAIWRQNAGLHLHVFHPSTSRVTLNRTYPTSTLGAYLDLARDLRGISQGRVVVLASLHDGSLQLQYLRDVMSEVLGSTFARQYLFGDSWVWVFVQEEAEIGREGQHGWGSEDDPVDLDALWYKDSIVDAIPEFMFIDTRAVAQGSVGVGKKGNVSKGQNITITEENMKSMGASFANITSNSVSAIMDKGIYNETNQTKRIAMDEVLNVAMNMETMGAINGNSSDVMDEGAHRSLVESIRSDKDKVTYSALSSSVAGNNGDSATGRGMDSGLGRNVSGIIQRNASSDMDKAWGNPTITPIDNATIAWAGFHTNTDEVLPMDGDMGRPMDKRVSDVMGVSEGMGGDIRKHEGEVGAAGDGPRGATGEGGDGRGIIDKGNSVKGEMRGDMVMNDKKLVKSDPGEGEPMGHDDTADVVPAGVGISPNVGATKVEHWTSRSDGEGSVHFRSDDEREGASGQVGKTIGSVASEENREGKRQINIGRKVAGKWQIGDQWMEEGKGNVDDAGGREGGKEERMGGFGSKEEGEDHDEAERQGGSITGGMGDAEQVLKNEGKQNIELVGEHEGKRKYSGGNGETEIIAKARKGGEDQRDPHVKGIKMEKVTGNEGRREAIVTTDDYRGREEGVDAAGSEEGTRTQMGGEGGSEGKARETGTVDSDGKDEAVTTIGKMRFHGQRGNSIDRDEKRDVDGEMSEEVHGGRGRGLTTKSRSNNEKRKELVNSERERETSGSDKKDPPLERRNGTVLGDLEKKFGNKGKEDGEAEGEERQDAVDDVGGVPNREGSKDSLRGIGNSKIENIVYSEKGKSEQEWGDGTQRNGEEGVVHKDGRGNGQEGKELRKTRLTEAIGEDESLGWVPAWDQTPSIPAEPPTRRSSVRTLAEVFVPNLGDFNSTNPPFLLHVPIPPYLNEDDVALPCPNWPRTPEWDLRRDFCRHYDGYGDLCGCLHTFRVFEDNDPPDAQLRDQVPPKSRFWHEDIPILVLAHSRPLYLYRLLRVLLVQPGVKRRLVRVFVDGYDLETLRLVNVLGLEVLLHRPEGIRAASVSRHLRFTLFHGLLLFPDASKFIVLEEDVVVTPDFYEFMQEASRILNLDPTVYCVSAFNHLCHPHTKGNPSRLLRVHSSPAYGWMMPRNVVEEFLPQWLPAHKENDWDYYIWQNLRTGRSCIVPETNRARHASTYGLHSHTSWNNFKSYLATALHNGAPVPLESPDRLVKESYDRHISLLIDQATILDPDQIYNHTFFAHEPGVYLLCVLQVNDNDQLSFKSLGDFLDVWSMDARDSYYNIWKIPIHNSTLLAAGVPASIYTREIFSKVNMLKKKTSTFKVEVLYATKEDEKDLSMQEVNALGRIPVISHRIQPFIFFGQMFMSPNVILLRRKTKV